MIDIAVSATTTALQPASGSTAPQVLQLPNSGADGSALANALPERGTEMAPPSVGRGQELQWAKSWTELSHRLQGLGKDSNQFFAQLGRADAGADPVASTLQQMGDLVRISGNHSNAMLQFHLLTGTVNNASAGVHKLLSQQ